MFSYSYCLAKALECNQKAAESPAPLRDQWLKDAQDWNACAQLRGGPTHSHFMVHSNATGAS